MLSTEVFKNIKSAWKQILIVTKYWDTKKTQQIINKAEEKYSDVYYGIWENRIEKIIEKELPRNQVHFIGNIQSKKIWDIVKCCSVIHSLYSIKHFKMIEGVWLPVQAFIQIHLDPEKSSWVREENLQELLNTCKDFKNLEIIWLSGMWAIWASGEEKKEEFQKLIRLRNTYLPNWLISAGTSIDYCLALENWIDIVRVGQKAVI